MSSCIPLRRQKFISLPQILLKASPNISLIILFQTLYENSDMAHSSNHTFSDSSDSDEIDVEALDASDNQEIDIENISDWNEEEYQQDSPTRGAKRKKVYLSTDAKQIAINVFNGLREFEELKPEAIKKTSCLTKIPIRTLRTILNVGAIARSKRRDLNTFKLDDFQMDSIRRKVYSMFDQNIAVTLKQLCTSLRQDGVISCSTETVRRVLKSLKFRYKKIDNRLRILEAPRLQRARIEYLDNIDKARKDNRFICYLDETWFNTHDVKKKGWLDASKNCSLNSPSGRGKRIIILHSGSEEGWVGECFLSAKSFKDLSIDYHNDMNAEIFEKWFSEKLLPSLPPKSAIVMDNAPYHSRQLEKIPNSSSTREEIQQFLSKNDLYFENYYNYTKKQLLEVLKIRVFTKKIVIDELAKKNGHIVVRLPPYYCVFNPIELIWSKLKGGVAANNVDPKNGPAVINLIRKQLGEVTPAIWKSCVQHTIKIEHSYKNV